MNQGYLKMPKIVCATLGDPVFTTVYEWDGSRWRTSAIPWRLLRLAIVDHDIPVVGATSDPGSQYPPVGAYSAELIYELTDEQFAELKKQTELTVA